MQKIRSGRAQRKNEQPNIHKKKLENSESKYRAADAAAIVFAVLCAASLCIFGVGKDTSSKDGIYQAAGSKTLGAITYTPPEQSDEWSFWDYFADVMAGVFGYNG